MWELVQIGSGHLSLENDCLEADAIKDILPALEKKFGKRMKFSGRLGFDLALSASAAELLIDEARITLGWDNWSGFFIMSWDENGDRIIKNEIADIFIKSS